MAEQDLLYRREDGVGIVTLHRPEKLNAITHPMHQRLHAIIEEIRGDDSVRVAILTGDGRAFCAGTDITGEVPISAEVEIANMKERSSTEYRDSQWYFNSLPKPMICAINGVAVGIGAEFSLHCDIRIAAEMRRGGHVFVLRGLGPH